MRLIINLSKFFTLVVLLNLVAVLLAASNRWSYARHHAGDFVLGNLQLAILVRNELFGRFVYVVVTTLFAKVVISFSQHMLKES